MPTATSSSSSGGTTDSERASSPPPLKRKRSHHTTNSDSSDDESSHYETETEESPEVPALSHAEKRRQKKKEKLLLKDTESSTATKRRKLDTKDGQTSKRQNSVWVGNMSFKTTTDSLKAFFDGVGEITRIHMPMKAGGVGGKNENRGFAYVDFATPEAKVIAITMSEKPLTGRRLLIKDGDDFAGRPAPPGEEGDVRLKSLTGLSKTAQKILRAQKQPPAPTLFLGNLGFETTEKSIREVLEAHRAKKRTDAKQGEQLDAEEGKPNAEKKDVWIRKIRMGTFEDSGLCKGWAFVDFTNIEHATAALVNPKNHHLDGRKLVVEYASPEAVRRGGGGPRPKQGDDNRANKWEGSKHKGDKARPSRLQDTKGPEASGPSEDVPMEQQAPIRDRPPHESRPSHAESGVTRGPKDRVSRNRTKPGAALAMAKRESAAIVPSQGKKIKF